MRNPRLALRWDLQVGWALVPGHQIQYPRCTPASQGVFCAGRAAPVVSATLEIQEVERNARNVGSVPTEGVLWKIGVISDMMALLLPFFQVAVSSASRLRGSA